MSILEEALRRKEAEQSGASPPSGPPLSFPPPTVPPPPARRRRVWPMVVGAIVASGAAAFVLWMWNRLSSQPVDSGTVPTAFPPTEHSPDAPKAIVAAPPSAPVPPSDGLDPTIDLEKPPSPEKSPAPPSATPLPVPPPRAAPAVRWPRLRLQGILAARGAMPSTALVNDRTLRIGDGIEGALLIEIGDGEVVFEMNGERRRMRIGEPSD